MPQLLRTNKIRSLGRQQLARLLLGSTINATIRLDAEDRAAVFAEYARRALPRVTFVNLRLNHSAASLNSISAFATLAADHVERQVFLKVHVEGASGVSYQNTAGMHREYQNAQALSEGGWPCVVPIMQSADEHYPLLVYNAFDADTKVLFDCLEKGYTTKNTDTFKIFLPLLDSFHRTIGRTQLETLTL